MMLQLRRTMQSPLYRKLSRGFASKQMHERPLHVSLDARVRSLKPSSTLAINEHSNELIAQGRTVYKLGLGQSPFPVPRAIQQALRDNVHQKDYLPVKGLPLLREQLCKMANVDSIEDVMIGPGSKELMFILQLVYGGELLLPRASWVSYAPQATILNRPVTWLDTNIVNGWKLTPNELEDQVAKDGDVHQRPRLLVLNYPSNPSGATYTASELKALTKVFRKYNILVLSDEIYGDTTHTHSINEGQHVGLSQFYPEGTIVSAGLSKWAGAGGYRLGYFIFPPQGQLRWLADAMAVVGSETFSAVSAPIQHAAVAAYKPDRDPSIDAFVARQAKILSALSIELHKRMSEAGFSVKLSDGGFYYMPDISAFQGQLEMRGIFTSQDFVDQLLDETGVAVLPGTDFGYPPERLIFRLAYVNFDGEKALKIVRDYEESQAQGSSADLPLELLEEIAPDTLKAIDLLISFTRGGHINVSNPVMSNRLLNDVKF